MISGSIWAGGPSYARLKLHLPKSDRFKACPIDDPTRSGLPHLTPRQEAKSTGADTFDVQYLHMSLRRVGRPRGEPPATVTNKLRPEPPTEFTSPETPPPPSPFSVCPCPARELPCKTCIFYTSSTIIPPVVSRRNMVRRSPRNHSASPTSSFVNLRAKPATVP